MLDVSWPLFVVASLFVIATPGQDMVLVLSRAMSGGVRAGIVTAAGVSTGLILHTVLATLGLGALLHASDWIFTALKLAGAAYLLYLGVAMLRASGGLALMAGADREQSALRSFAQGAMSNISNPKVAIFYLAFLPQFVRPDAPRPALSMFVLGVTFAGLTFLTKGPVALFAGLLSDWVQRHPRFLVGLYRTSGVVLLGLGLKLAFERRN